MSGDHLDLPQPDGTVINCTRHNRGECDHPDHAVAPTPYSPPRRPPIGQYRATVVTTGDDHGPDDIARMIVLGVQMLGFNAYIETLDTVGNTPAPAPRASLTYGAREALSAVLTAVRNLDATGMHGQIMRSEVIAAINATADGLGLYVETPADDRPRKHATAEVLRDILTALDAYETGAPPLNHVAATAIVRRIAKDRGLVL